MQPICALVEVLSLQKQPTNKTNKTFDQSPQLTKRPIHGETNTRKSLTMQLKPACKKKAKEQILDT